MSLTLVQPDGWVPPRGYANGIVAEGKFLFTGGVVGWNARSLKPEFPATFAEQFDLALSNIVEILRAGGAAPSQLVRMTIYVTDKKEYLASLKACGAAWRKHIGGHYLAMALVQVAALVEDLAKLEIEATAALGG